MTTAEKQEMEQLRRDLDQMVADAARNAGTLNRLAAAQKELVVVKEELEQVLRNQARLKARLIEAVDEVPGIIGVTIKLPPKITALFKRIRDLASTIPS